LFAAICRFFAVHRAGIRLSSVFLRVVGVVEQGGKDVMERRRIIRSAGTVGGLTLVSRGLGLIRDVLMAGFFGTSVYMSAFVVAFTVPNLFRRLFGEGALASSFVPVFMETREQSGDAAALQLMRKVFSLLLTVLAGITLVGLALAFFVGYLPGLPEKWRLIFAYSQIMFPYMLFICLAALFMAFLNARHHFAMPAFTPCLLNVVWIFAVLAVCPRIGGGPERQIYAVAWAVLLAGLLQAGAQLPVLWRCGWRPGFELDLNDRRLRQMLLLAGPAALGLAVTQVNVLMDRLLAMWAGAYAPAALFYSERLIYFPLGIFATALGTVLLPAFSGQAARGEHAAIRDGIERSLRQLLFIMIPAAAGLSVLSYALVGMLLQWGAFDAGSAFYTGLALQCYAPGLVVFSLAKVFVPAFYAFQDTRTPVRIGVWMVGLNFALNITFILLLPPGMKHAGIALGTVLAEAAGSVWMLKALQRRTGRLDWFSLVRSFARFTVAALIMAAAVWWVYQQATGWLVLNGYTGRMVEILPVLMALGLGVITYFLAAFVLKMPELREIHEALRRH